MRRVQFIEGRGAPDPDPDPDPAGYPVDFVDPVWIRIRPDPKSLDPVRIRIRPDPAGSKITGSGWDPDPAGSLVGSGSGRIRPDPGFVLKMFPTMTLSIKRMLGCQHLTTDMNV